MRAVGDRPDTHRLCALIVRLWRAGLRISEALALQESDLDRGRGAVLVRRGKAASAAKSGPTDRWAWDQLGPWFEIRPATADRRPAVRDPPTHRRTALGSISRSQTTASRGRCSGRRRRFTPHQLRHAHAVEMAHEGVPLVVIQRELGHAKLGITSIYLQGIDSSEIIRLSTDGRHRRSPPPPAFS